MIKAKDIKYISKRVKKYKKLLKNEIDPIKQLEYKRLIRKEEYNLIDVEYQLLNIRSELSKSIFIDRYIKGLTGIQMCQRYNMSKTTVYKKLSSARLEFEGNKVNS